MRAIVTIAVMQIGMTQIDTVVYTAKADTADTIIRMIEMVASILRISLMHTKHSKNVANVNKSEINR